MAEAGTRKPRATRATTAKRSDAKAPAKGSDAKPAARTRRPPRSAKQKVIEETARAYFDSVAARDPDAMASHWSEDGVEDIVPLGVFRGPEGVRGLFRELFAAIPDFEFTVTRVVADERVAAVQYRAVGNFTGGPFQGLQANGAHIELRGVDMVEVEDGKIVRNTAFYDGADFARQLGMLPAQDSGAERAMKSALNAVTKVRRAIDERRH